MIKTAKDFKGYWIKNLVNFKGHEGEPLFQCTVYKDGKKIGFFSEDSHGGPARFDGIERKYEEQLNKDAQEFSGSDYVEEYHSFICKIAEAVDTVKYLRKHCKKKALFYLRGDAVGSYRTMKAPWKGNESKIEEYLSEKYGDGGYTIINKSLESLGV